MSAEIASIHLSLIRTYSQLPKLIPTKCIDGAFSGDANGMPQASSNSFNFNSEKRWDTFWTQLIICTTLPALDQQGMEAL